MSMPHNCRCAVCQREMGGFSVLKPLSDALDVTNNELRAENERLRAAIKRALDGPVLPYDTYAALCIASGYAPYLPPPADAPEAIAGDLSTEFLADLQQAVAAEVARRVVAELQRAGTLDRVAPIPPPGYVTGSGKWAHCERHDWWHPPDAPCKECDPEGYRQWNKSSP